MQSRRSEILLRRPCWRRQSTTTTRRPAICGGRGRRNIHVGTTPIRRESRVKQQQPFLLSTGGRYHSSRDELLLIVTRVLLLLVPIFNVGLYVLSLWLLFLSVFIVCILSECITCSSLLLFLLFNISLFINEYLRMATLFWITIGTLANFVT